MSDVHFFIDPSGISSQSNTQQFGPVNANEYRVTSSFTISGSPTAYAICRGRVLVQPQTGATGVVNLILKPMDQPIEGINIKYFVYRGLSEASFFTTSGADKVVIPASGASDLVVKMRTEFTNFHNLDPDPEPLFLAKFIGYDPTVAGTTMLDNLFFKESDWASTTAENHFELPMIAKGKSLGTFTGSNCGIDVVINYGDYIPDADELEFSFDLNYARAAYGKIVPAGTDAQLKTMREQIFEFMDIAAFYGYFQPSTTGVSYGALTSNTSKTGNGIYTDLLDKFATKNNLYVYLYGDRKRSYNFYGNYNLTDLSQDSLKTGIVPGATTPLTIKQYSTPDGWPILIDNSTRSGGGSTNTLYLKLSCGTSNGILYLMSGNYSIPTTDKWMRFKNLQSSTDKGFTDEILLTVPATSGKNIAGFYILLYRTADLLARVNVLQSAPTQYNEVKIIDGFAFGINNTSAFKFTGTGIVERTFADLKQGYGGKTIHPDNSKYSITETVRIETTIDLGSSTADLVSYAGYAAASLFTAGASVSPRAKNYPSYITKPSPAGGIISEFLAEYELVNFTDNTTAIASIRVIDETKETNNLFFLGITQTENGVLKQVVEDNNVVNSSICFRDISPDGEPIVSVESVSYSKYKLGIVGETDGSLSIFFPSTDVIVYSLSGKAFLSKSYGDTVEHIIDISVVAKTDFEEQQA